VAAIRSKQGHHGVVISMGGDACCTCAPLEEESYGLRSFTWKEVLTPTSVSKRCSGAWWKRKTASWSSMMAPSPAPVSIPELPTTAHESYLPSGGEALAGVRGMCRADRAL
jgi:hypothetical protein